MKRKDSTARLSRLLSVNANSKSTWLGNILIRSRTSHFESESFVLATDHYLLERVIDVAEINIDLITSQNKNKADILSPK